MEMNIELDGRKLVKTEIIEQTATRIVSKFTYDDGTIIQYIQESDVINVECNKNLVVQPDGKTVKIV
jgi:hypothetical protein